MSDQTWPFEFVLLNERASAAQLGDLPRMLSTNNPRPARDQLDAGYKQMGGWRPFRGFTLGADYGLVYPGDPPLFPWAAGQLRDETILVYPHDWVVIRQQDGAFEVCRMD
jgi:hypothetical protein